MRLQLKVPSCQLISCFVYFYFLMMCNFTAIIDLMSQCYALWVFSLTNVRIELCRFTVQSVNKELKMSQHRGILCGSTRHAVWNMSKGGHGNPHTCAHACAFLCTRKTKRGPTREKNFSTATKGSRIHRKPLSY